jgi:hypothetical protein
MPIPQIYAATSPFPPVPACFPPQGQEGVLDRLVDHVRQRASPGQPHGQPPGVPVIKHGQRLLIAPCYPAQQRRVIALPRPTGLPRRTGPLRRWALLGRRSARPHARSRSCTLMHSLSQQQARSVPSSDTNSAATPTRGPVTQALSPDPLRDDACRTEVSDHPIPFLTELPQLGQGTSDLRQPAAAGSDRSLRPEDSTRGRQGLPRPLIPGCALLSLVRTSFPWLRTPGSPQTRQIFALTREKSAQLGKRAPNQG